MRAGLSESRAAVLLVIAANRADMRHLATNKETAIHKIADTHLDAMTVAIRYAFAKGRRALGKNANVSAATRAVKSALLDVLPGTLRKVMKSGGDVATTALVKQLRTAELRALKTPARKPEPVKPTLTMRFDVSNPLAVKWANEHAAELAKDISQTTEDDIKRAVARATEDGDLDELYDSILDAVGNDARAEMIARTEIMTAANEGQREAWDQAAEHGLLDAKTAMRVWIATGDACPLCEELDGEETTLDGEYPNDGGDGPPLHPNCRCTEGIAA